MPAALDVYKPERWLEAGPSGMKIGQLIVPLTDPTAGPEAQQLARAGVEQAWRAGRADASLHPPAR